MANVITNPTWIKAKPHASAEKQVGDSDPSARTDVINRPVKGVVSVMTKWLETFHLAGTFDFTNTTSTTPYTGIGIIPCAASTAATPEQHGLYRDNVLKAWAFVTVAGGVPSLTDSFNISSVTDNAVADFTLAFDRDFANATYAWCGVSATAGRTVVVPGDTFVQSTGSLRYRTADIDGGYQDFTHVVIAIGAQ